MRWFWLFFIVLIIAALVALMRSNTNDEPTAIMNTPTLSAPTSPEPTDVIRVDARTIQLDGRFDVSGTGSISDPYKITWPLMLSAQSGMGSDGVITVPKYISLLDGTSIEISGYLAPPVARDLTEELLVMRNRWDGCCIGTPPTPFDCIEVRLDKAIPVKGKHLIQYGTIRGILRVEPFSAGKYLLGLYRIEHGQVEGFGG
jgi:hypothetical protein